MTQTYDFQLNDTQTNDTQSNDTQTDDTQTDDTQTNDTQSMDTLPSNNQHYRLIAHSALSINDTQHSNGEHNPYSAQM